jgi:hypothetical protein
VSKVQKSNGDEEQQIGNRIEKIRGKIKDELVLAQSQGIAINMPALLADCSRVASIKLLIEKGILDEDELELKFQDEIYDAVIGIRRQHGKSKLQKGIILPGGGMVANQ